MQWNTGSPPVKFAGGQSLLFGSLGRAPRAHDEGRPAKARGRFVAVGRSSRPDEMPVPVPVPVPVAVAMLGLLFQKIGVLRSPGRDRENRHLKVAVVLV